MSQLFSLPFVPALALNLDYMGAASLNFYLAGTLTPADVYSDPDLMVSLGSVVTADAYGRFVNVYLSDDNAYRVILKNSSDVVIGDAELTSLLYSPAFGGEPTAPTPLTSDNSTRIATTEWVRDILDQSSGSSLVGFTPNGSGAVVTTVQEKLRERWSVLDFGAVSSILVDSTAAFNLAATTVGALGGGEIEVIGKFKVNGEILVSYPNVYFDGKGEDCSEIKQFSTTSNTFRFYNATPFTGGGVRNLTLSHNSTPTSGADIYVDGASALWFERIWFRTSYHSIFLAGNNRACRMDHLDSSDHVSDAFVVNGGGNQYFDNCTTFRNVSATGNVPFRIYQTDATWLNRCVTQVGGGALWVTPGSGQYVTDIWVTDCDFDSSKVDSVVFDSGASGRITTVMWNSSRIGFSDERGLVVDGANTRHLQFNGLKVEKCIKQGVVVNNGHYIDFMDAQVMGNSSSGPGYNGIEVYGGDGIKFVGGASGPYSTDGNNQGYGAAVLLGFTGLAQFIGMDLRGNATGAFSNSSVGSTVRTLECAGKDF
jgi:hypothetical protein